MAASSSVCNRPHDTATKDGANVECERWFKYDPTTKKIERRLDDAQLAIDGAAALIDLVSARVTDAERRELNTMLMNLRINYVEQRNKG